VKVGAEKRRGLSQEHILLYADAMMRSTAAPRIDLDTVVTVEAEEAFTGKVKNLSVGGIFVETLKVLQPGEQVGLMVEMRDGQGPLAAQGEVVWARPDQTNSGAGMALRFVELDELSERRIEKLVAQNLREPTGRIRRDVRIRLPALPSPLRAVARDQTEQGIMLEAELPWLQLGAEVVTELSPTEARVGRVQWIGLDVTRAGSARLRIFVETEPVESAVRLPPPAEQSSAQNRVVVAERLVTPTPKAPPRAWKSWARVAAAGAMAAGLTAFVMRPPPPAMILRAALAEPVVVAKPHPPTVVAIPKEKPEEVVAVVAPPPPPKRHPRKARK
jgi:uncharacterized protein (TIGR02266 family)